MLSQQLLKTDRSHKLPALDEHAAHTAGRWVAIWKLDSESLAYAADGLFSTRELTTGTAFGSVGCDWARWKDA